MPLSPCGSVSGPMTAPKPVGLRGSPDALEPHMTPSLTCSRFCCVCARFAGASIGLLADPLAPGLIELLELTLVPLELDRSNAELPRSRLLERPRSSVTGGGGGARTAAGGIVCGWPHAAYACCDGRGVVEEYSWWGWRLGGWSRGRIGRTDLEDRTSGLKWGRSCAIE